MITLTDCPQGSPAWHAARANRFGASEAAAAMGLSKYTTRTDLLKQKSTGIAEEVSPAKQRLFDAGHKAEEDARPIAEDIAGMEFFPAVGLLDYEGLPLLASFDGIDILEEVIWENKLHNKKLANQVLAGELEPHYWAQLEHQLLVSGASKALFTVSDGTHHGTESTWYYSIRERRAQLIAAWKQFAIDLAAYVPTEAATPVMATPQLQLPAVSIQVNGSIALIDNLPDFGVALTAYIERINKKPETDQDFADLESSVKALKAAEDALAAAESGALAQTASIDTMRRTVALYIETARTNRLLIEKLVKAEKKNRRSAILFDVKTALGEHIANLNGRLGARYMPFIEVDFAAAVRGLKSLDSMRDKVADALARGKIEANEVADRIQANLTVLNGFAADYKMLFPDIAQLVLKDTDDLVAVVQSRILAHQETAAKRLDAERVRIRAEEVAKLAQANQTAMEDQQTRSEGVLEKPTASVASTLPTLKLGMVGERLGIPLSADTLKMLGFEPAMTAGASKLFHERDFPLICDALIARISDARARHHD